jgi:hypothetical protein
VVVLPNLHKVFLLAPGIEELVLVEEPELEVLGHFLRSKWREVRGKRDLSFLGLEITIGLLGIVDGWHEVRPIVAALQQSGICCQEGETGGRFFCYTSRCNKRTDPLFHDEHTEHFAFGRMDTLDLPFHLFCRKDA